MRKISKIVGSSALILAFGLFNVGLPVVLYLCPMMSQSGCPMSHDSGNRGLSLVNQSPSCCGKVVVAERNTNPFVKIQQVEHQKASVVVIVHSDIQRTPFCITDQPFANASPPGDPPLFLLNATFLI